MLITVAMDTTLRSVNGPPVENGAARRIVLEPGQLSRPEKVWATSSTLIIGFHQAAPYSESFKIFYKVCLTGRAPFINPVTPALHAYPLPGPKAGPVPCYPRPSPFPPFARPRPEIGRRVRHPGDAVPRHHPGPRAGAPPAA